MTLALEPGFVSLPKLDPPWFELFETLAFTGSVVLENESEAMECDVVPAEEEGNVVELAVEDFVPFPGAETKPGEEVKTVTLLTPDGDDSVDELREAWVENPGFELDDPKEALFIALDEFPNTLLDVIV